MSNALQIKDDLSGKVVSGFSSIETVRKGHEKAINRPRLDRDRINRTYRKGELELKTAKVLVTQNRTVSRVEQSRVGPGLRHARVRALVENNTHPPATRCIAVSRSNILRRVSRGV